MLRLSALSAELDAVELAPSLVRQAFKDVRAGCTVKDTRFDHPSRTDGTNPEIESRASAALRFWYHCRNPLFR